MSILFGVKIILKDKSSPVSEENTIGLYNVAGENSEFRWLQGMVDGVSGWNANMIIKNGLARFTREIDLRKSGNTASPGSCSVTVTNHQKLWNLCENKSIYFPGCKCIIYRFDNDVSTPVWVGECLSPYWNLTDFTIPLKRTYQGRIANILTEVNTDLFPHASSDTIGKTIPGTFGKLTPSFSSDGTLTRSSFAKFIRTLDEEETDFYSDTYFSQSAYIDTFDFPITNINPASERKYDVDLRGVTPSLSMSFIYPENTFVKVTDGTGADQIREVYSIDWIDDFLQFVVSDFFETELQDDDTDNNRSWIRFVKIYRRYDADTRTCEGFYNKDGNKLSTGAELYTHSDEDGYSMVAPYGYDFRESGNQNNKIAIDPKLFDQGNIDQQNSIMILPVENLSALTEADLSNWLDIGASFIKDGTYDGLYAPVDGMPAVVNSFTINNLPSATDKNSTTYGSIVLDGVEPSACSYMEVLRFTLPKVPKNFSFDSCILGIKLLTDVDIGSLLIKTVLRKFKYKKIQNDFISRTNASTDDMIVDNMPDFFFSDQPQTNNENFFLVQTDEENIITGHTNPLFNTGIADRDEYQNYIEGVILIWHIVYPYLTGAFVNTTKIYDLSMIFKKASDIKTNLYTPLYGRIYNDTFDGRKTMGSVITSPIDIHEDINRSQNYTDMCIEQPTSGWGKGYASGSLPIKLSGDGSFDAAELDDIRSFEAAAQITNFDDGYTDALKRSLCKEFHFADWVDSFGSQCVRRIAAISPSPSDLVTMASISDRKSIKILYPDISSVYVEPFVKYDRDPAAGQLKSVINIFNTSSSVYNGSFVQGISGTLAEELWTLCHNEWLKCSIVNKPPTDMTDMIWANGAQSASIAEHHLREWIYNMSRREIEFSGHLNDFGSWEECHRYIVQFQHQTNNVQKQCIAEMVSVNPNPPYDVTVRGLML